MKNGYRDYKSVSQVRPLSQAVLDMEAAKRMLSAEVRANRDEEMRGILVDEATKLVLDVTSGAEKDQVDLRMVRAWVARRMKHGVNGLSREGMERIAARHAYLKAVSV